ncbi:replication endonuclease [Comamonas jiangduensis]|uniref:Replication endonuclease n=1 Tax=Comamonas jiangduensis TaxID=1194168 RepID=A0ABV4IBA3_9BURK
MARKPITRAVQHAARSLPTASLKEWKRHKPAPWMAKRALDALLRAVPEQWRQPIALSGLGKLDLHNPDPAPLWLQSWDAMQAIAEFDQRFGRASSWNLTDGEICALAKRIVQEAQELDAAMVAEGADVPQRIDSVRMLLRMLGVQESRPLQGEPDIKRSHDPKWWRMLLRKHVARVVEGGAVRLGVVNRKQGGYASDLAVRRRQNQIERNHEALKRSLFKNEAGQIWTLAELSALSPSNPIIRGGELMTRIRGAEEYADARNHVGLFFTQTAPSRFHPMTVGAGGRPRPNPRYDGVSTPRDAQMWLRTRWARFRAHLKSKGIHIYGIRVAEPHHDATPHWHMLIWAETEAEAQYVELAMKVWWLAEDGDEPGAFKNRVNCKRMTSGGAAGYVAKYIAKSVGHAALADHLDVVQGQLWDVEQNDMPGHRRVDAWAATWGIRQFQAIGMPSVCVWRELRRVGKDQINTLHRAGDLTTHRAWVACHREGNIQANWRVYMEAMGGHCRPRGQWHLRMAHRPLRDGECNQYGEALTVGRVVGLQTARGQWLISRRLAWTPVAAETETFNPELCTDSDSGCSLAIGEARAAMPRAWTGFNNCRGRLTGELRRALLGRGTHEAEDCLPGFPGRSSDEWRSIGPSPIPFY